jgi:dTMP kinase
MDPLKAASSSAEVVPSRGRFLVLEGIDGSGKTTQLEALRTWLPDSGLMSQGARLVVTREPGGTDLGLALRELLLHPPQGCAPAPTTELLLYAADRAQHVECLLKPALQAGDWVVSDRYTGSTLAYQGYGRGVSMDLITSLESIATAGLQADLTIWLDVPVPLSLTRRGDRTSDRIESAGGAFLTRVAEGFAALAAQRAWQRVDATLPAAMVTAACRKLLLERLDVPTGTHG